MSSFEQSMGKYTDIKLEKLGRFLRYLESIEGKEQETEKLIQAIKNQMEYLKQETG